MRQFVNAANLITTAGLAAGFAALMLAGDGELGWATAAVGVAAVLDSVDGLVARRTSVCGPFGCNLDSLTDLVAFGVAPALILYNGVLHELSVIGPAACTAFVVAGAWRLARFPLIEDRQHFIGLPIPPAGVIATAAGVLALPAGIAAAVCFVLALLMVSQVAVPTLAEIARLLPPRTVVVAGDGPPDGTRAGERPGAERDDGERRDQDGDDERVRAPALAGK